MMLLLSFTLLKSQALFVIIFVICCKVVFFIIIQKIAAHPDTPDELRDIALAISLVIVYVQHG